MQTALVVVLVLLFTLLGALAMAFYSKPSNSLNDEETVPVVICVSFTPQIDLLLLTIYTPKIPNLQLGILAFLPAMYGRVRRSARALIPLLIFLVCFLSAFPNFVWVQGLQTCAFIMALCSHVFSLARVARMHMPEYAHDEAKQIVIEQSAAAIFFALIVTCSLWEFNVALSAFHYYKQLNDHPILLTVTLLDTNLAKTIFQTFKQPSDYVGPSECKKLVNSDVEKKQIMISP